MPPPRALGSLRLKVAEKRVSGLLVCAWCLFLRRDSPNVVVGACLRCVTAYDVPLVWRRSQSLHVSRRQMWLRCILQNSLEHCDGYTYHLDPPCATTVVNTIPGLQGRVLTATS